MNPSELLQRQAAAVKSAGNAANILKAAEFMKKAAALLEEEGKKAVRVDFKGAARDRISRAEARALKVTASFAKERHENIERYGWHRGFHNDKTGESTYGMPQKMPGYQLKIHGGRFSLYNGTEVKIDKLEVAHLETFLEKFKKDNKV